MEFSSSNCTCECEIMCNVKSKWTNLLVIRIFSLKFLSEFSKINIGTENQSSKFELTYNNSRKFPYFTMMHTIKKYIKNSFEDLKVDLCTEFQVL